LANAAQNPFTQSKASKPSKQASKSKSKSKSKAYEQAKQQQQQQQQKREKEEEAFLLRSVPRAQKGILSTVFVLCPFYRRTTVLQPLPLGGAVQKCF
jgi:hypothetical protein